MMVTNLKIVNDQKIEIFPNDSDIGHRYDIPKKESRLEISIQWFDQWNFQWSCTETTWKKLSLKLASPLQRGLAIGTGVAIGVGASVYGFVQIDKALNPAARSTQIEAPTPKR
jgi:hypothetical protein